MEIDVSDAHKLARYVIEYLENLNAAGEYDGNDPEFKDQVPEWIILPLAKKVLSL